MINNILQLYLDKLIIIYNDDIIIYSNTKEEYLEYVKKILKTLSNYQLYTKQLKYMICIINLEFYGYMIGNNIINLMVSKVKIINEKLISKMVYKV